MVVAGEEAVAGTANGLNGALEAILDHHELADLDVAQRRLAIRSLLIENDRSELLGDIAAIIDGYGALDGLMNDPSVTDILVNGVDDVWVERDGRLTATDVRFRSLEDLELTIERLMSRGGGRVDSALPISDVALPDGSRMHVVLPPLSPTGPKISIRRFPREPISLEELEARGMLDASTRARLEDAIRDRATVAISGGTGSGKTTLLNAMLSLIADDERLVTLEETPELRPRCTHWVSLIARPPNVEGTGEVTLADLFRATLRMRPDRIVVGEVRGAEAVVALDAFSVGHPGSLVTIHARSAEGVADRFVGLAAASGLSERTLQRRVRDAFDLFVHLERDSGVRRVREITRP